VLVKPFVRIQRAGLSESADTIPAPCRITVVPAVLLEGALARHRRVWPMELPMELRALRWQLLAGCRDHR
jgi:hypothetical protein